MHACSKTELISGKISWCHNLMLSYLINQRLLQLQKSEFSALLVALILKKVLESCSSSPSLRAFTLWEHLWDVLARVSYLQMFLADFNRENWTPNGKLDPLTIEKQMSKLKSSGKEFGLNAINIWGDGSVGWLVCFGQGKRFKWGEFYWLYKHKVYGTWIYFLSSNLWWIIPTVTHLQCTFRSMKLKNWSRGLRTYSENG